jgi:predicted metal-dependent HD superfamily phosphohydrolase
VPIEGSRLDEGLQRRWHDLTRLLGIDEPECERVLADLAARHEEPHRAYHTLAHLRHVLEVVDFIEQRERVDDSIAVRLAAWFHDAVYEPGAADNEGRSAKLAAEVLTDWQVPADRVAHVHGLVLATAHHLPETSDEAVLVDADLAILAADPDTYQVYTRAVRVEYGHLDEAEWRAGRAAFLTGMLDRDPLYVTRTMRRRGEAAARRNLTGELERLHALR